MKKLRDFDFIFKININNQVNMKVANSYYLETLPVLEDMSGVTRLLNLVQDEIISLAREIEYQARLDKIFKNRSAK